MISMSRKRRHKKTQEAQKIGASHYFFRICGFCAFLRPYHGLNWWKALALAVGLFPGWRTEALKRSLKPPETPGSACAPIRDIRSFNSPQVPLPATWTGTSALTRPTPLAEWKTTAE